ncbi:DUF2934 domain-containing protein [Falsirhodobacter deserti]|uniref:DUF2934 domain-containing protein n=1 Tax=Falsirhodobacter deserti TaxID=1365611 RepID=UPI0013E2AF9C|nr:DUF2934 domain-containing protein [Falsirhodobacter deserti]
MDEERMQRVRDRAHALWEQAGCPDGQDMDHWSQAEREIAAEDDAEPSVPTKKGAGRGGRKPTATAEEVAKKPKAKRGPKPKVVAEGSGAVS